MTFGVPDSPGVPADVAKYTLTAFNDLAVSITWKLILGKSPVRILEPAGNMGLVPPVQGFGGVASGDACTHDKLLIFDEVMRFPGRLRGCRRCTISIPT